MLTVQMLTRNNSATVKRAIESVSSLNCEVVIGDLGSTDDTCHICTQMGATVLRLSEPRRHLCRQKMMELYKDAQILYVEPWEMLVKGHKRVLTLSQGYYYASVLQDKIVTKDIRLYHWTEGLKFHNPVYEYLDADTNNDAGAVFYSIGGLPIEEALASIEQWKQEEPLAHQPYYYHACLLFSQGRWDDFLRATEHYLYLDRSQSVSATMARYYYAYVQLTQKQRARPALQNLNLCLCTKPLMAEFWCLTGDVYYHLLNRFSDAKEFYQNALVMGSKRLQTDRWPMDIVKYNQYPTKMIESCDAILSSSSVYAPNRT